MNGGRLHSACNDNPFSTIDITQPIPIQFVPLAIPPHAHRTARTVQGSQRTPQNRMAGARIDSRTDGKYRQQRTCSAKGKHLIASLTEHSLYRPYIPWSDPYCLSLNVLARWASINCEAVPFNYTFDYKTCSKRIAKRVFL
jgi:hypothetical protein